MYTVTARHHLNIYDSYTAKIKRRQIVDKDA